MKVEPDMHSNTCGGLAGFSAILMLCKILESLCAEANRLEFAQDA